MGALSGETSLRITKLLKRHPRGLMISDMASRLKINRNLMAKYLEILLISGDVEMDIRGNAKLFTLSRRIPIFTFLENISDYVIMLDSSGRILRVNSPVLVLLGSTQGDIVGRKCREIDHPLFVALPCSENPETAEHARDISCILDNMTRCFRVKQTPLVLADGSRGSLLICEDITAETRSREMMELSEARFRTIIEDQTDFIIRFLPDGKLTFVNGSWARFLGKTPDDLHGTDGLPQVTGEDRQIMEEQIRRLDRASPVIVTQFRVPDLSGTIHWQQWTFRALFNGDGSFAEYQGVGRDVSARFEAETLVREYTSNLAFLSEKAREFSLVRNLADLQRKIVEDVAGLLPGSYIALSTFNTDTKVSTIRAAHGKDLEKTFQGIFHTSLVGVNFLITDPTAYKILASGRLGKIYGNLYTGFFCQMPFDACIQMEEALNMGDIFSMGFISGNGLLGNIAIVIQKGHPPPPQALLEAYLSQASLALAWRSG